MADEFVELITPKENLDYAFQTLNIEPVYEILVENSTTIIVMSDISITGLLDARKYNYGTEYTNRSTSKKITIFTKLT